MKLLALCVVGALAAQDSTPPVVSLDLNNLRYAELDCHLVERSGGPDGPHQCFQKHTANSSQRSATCEVYSSASDCPIPTCHAIDHHDSRLNGPGIQCDAPKFTPVQIGAKTITTKEREELVGAEYKRGDRLAALDIEAKMRKLRSEWVLTFGAKDAAGNEAEKVSFTMIFQDTVSPQLKTEFYNEHYEKDGENDKFACMGKGSNAAQCDGLSKNVCQETSQCIWKHHHSNYHQVNTVHHFTSPMKKNEGAGEKKWAESCSLCGYENNEPWGVNADFSLRTCAEACKYQLKQDHESLNSIDNYDKEDVTKNIRAAIFYDSRTMMEMTNVEDLSESFNIDTHMLGTWTVVYKSHDNAGIFGFEEQNNWRKQSVDIEVSDNTPPQIYRNTYESDAKTEGAKNEQSGRHHTVTIECESSGSQYREMGAFCLDRRDSWNPSQKEWVKQEAQWEYPLNWAKAGIVILATDTANEQTVMYSCTDGESNKAVTFRKVRTVDTVKPVLKLEGPKTVENSAGAHKGSDFESALGFFDPAQYGVGFQPHTIDNPTPEAAAFKSGFGGDLTSEWKGATCEDTCDTKPTIISTLHHGGDCTGALVTGTGADGDLRNFNQEKHEYSAHGTLYSVRYTCFDGTTGDARARLYATECRQIMNVDKTRPIIQILGSDDMTLEATHAGNYVDDGATCSDQVDGVISQNVEVSGDVVNLSKIGTYTVWYNCKDSRGNSAPSLSRTVVVRQTRCPTCTIEHCPNHHTAEFKCSMTHEASFEYVDAGAKCIDNIDGEVRVTVDNGVDVEKTGTYYVTYTARNSAGLWNDGKHGAGREDGDSCKDGNGKPDNRRYVRTVVIKDSLKPVISVRYKGVQVDTGLSGQDATGDKAKTYRNDQDMENPADKWAKDQIVMMSEQAVQGSRMWALAGAAAAVAGLALLGMSHRRTVTSVPV